MVRSLDSRRKNAAAFRKVLVGCIIMLFGVIQYFHARLSRSMNSYMRNLRHSHNAPHDIVASEADTTVNDANPSPEADLQRYSHQNTNHHYAAGQPPFQQYHGSSNNQEITSDQRARMEASKAEANRRREASQQRAQTAAHPHQHQHQHLHNHHHAPAQRNEGNSHDNEDTAIIITSAWMPSHPSTYMIEMVMNSTKLLTGLSPTAPIFITIFRITLTS